MKKIRTLIADDEPLARSGLNTQLGSDADIEVIGTAADGDAALDAIREGRPDLVFLDIQMPKKDGFAVLAGLKPSERPVVIFSTAYDQHAIRAFEFSAIDYLLKPFSDARFTVALTRAKELVWQQRASDMNHCVEELLKHVQSIGSLSNSPGRASPLPEYSERIVLKADGALHFIKSADVLWIEAQGDFIKVQASGKVQLVRETLQSMERKLDAAKFLRIHRSYIVNLDHVRKVELGLYGDYVVTVSDGSKLRMSRNYRSKLKALTQHEVDEK